MIIDIEPEIRSANDTQKTILEMREINHLYVFEVNGKEETVEFDDKRFDEFLPNRTVSEMLELWQQGIKDRIKLYENSIEKNIHPYWTRDVRVMDPISNTWTGQVIKDQPVDLTKDHKKYLLKEIEELKLKTAKWKFVKIC